MRQLAIITAFLVFMQLPIILFTAKMPQREPQLLKRMPGLRATM